MPVCQPVSAPTLAPTLVPLPLFGSTVPAGFPSPADDHLDEPLDLNRFLVRRPAATFLVRVRGGSMTSAGIHEGDLLVVDRSITATDGKIVVAALNGELTVKRLSICEHGLFLLPEAPGYPPIRVPDGADVTIWGVVVHAIHTLR